MRVRRDSRRWRSSIRRRRRLRVAVARSRGVRARRRTRAALRRAGRSPRRPPDRPPRRVARRARTRSRRFRRPGSARSANAARIGASGPASARAPCELAARRAPAAVAAISGSTPSRSRAARSTSSATGSKSMRWQRDRIVGRRSSAAAVTSSTIVRGGGSSIVFNIAFADSFWLPRSRSASNRISTRRSASIGARAASGRIVSRTSSFTRYDAPPGANSTTSGCTPRCTSRRLRSSSPTPISSAAKSRAASSTPEPARTDEQVRVRRSLTRASQRLDRTLLTDHIDEHALILGTFGETRLDDRPDPLGDLTGRTSRVDDHPARDPAASSRYALRTAAWKSAPSRSKRSRNTRDARLGDVVGEVEHDHDVGLDVRGHLPAPRARRTRRPCRAPRPGTRSSTA